MRATMFVKARGVGARRSYTYEVLTDRKQTVLTRVSVVKEKETV